MAQAAPPLSPSEFAALMARLGPFEPAPRLAVAVSGGADSLGLALLAHDWARDRGGEVLALTVDHGLRPGSAAEAAAVGAWVSARGLPHRPLRWEGDKPGADLQAAARAARYRLLGETCRAEGILHLLLAHHRDDQAETMLLRLGRGSGVDGLAAMSVIQETAWGRLLRPLLDVPRARLAATLRAVGQDWVEDPSNRNPAFARVRLRALLPALAAEGLTAERLAATARRLGRARHGLERATAELAARHLTLHPAGYALADPTAFTASDEEVALRLLGRLLRCVGGGEYAPRLDRLEALLAALRGGLAAARTLGGCRIAPWRGRLVVCREAARMAPPVALVPGAESVWDGRFRLRLPDDAPPGLRLGGLGNGSGVSGLSAIPAPARPTVPAIRDQDGVCVVPHLGYNHGAHEGLTAHPTLRSIVMAPAVPLTVAGHCLV